MVIVARSGVSVVKKLSVNALPCLMGCAPPTCAVQPCTVPVHKVVDGARRVITQVLGLRANGEPRTWSVYAAGGGGRGQPRSWKLVGFLSGKHGWKTVSGRSAGGFSPAASGVH